MSRISFRARIALLTALAIAVTVAAASFAVWVIAKHELYSQLDSTLVTQATSGGHGPFGGGNQLTLVIHPDGSFSGDVAGPNLLWTAQDKLPESPKVPTISYTTGHLTFAVDASGKTTSYSLAGGQRQTDVCAALAS